MKVKVQFPANIGVVELFWDRDGQPDIEPLRLGSAAIGRLHNPGTSAGTDDKAPLLAVELLRPGSQALGERSRRLVIDREPEGRLRGFDALTRPLRLGQRRLRRLLRV